MIHRRSIDDALPTGFTALCLLLALGAAAHGQQRVEAHAEARALANELVTLIFDIQLRRLEENDLEQLPLYQEIRTSRDRIARLASDDMQRLARLLTELQAARDDDRSRLLAEARTTARQIAVAMMAERQRLRGRLRSSRTTLLLRQMIALEQQAIVAAEGLTPQQDSKHRQIVEQVIQSHLDLAVLIEQLVQMLGQVKETAGQDRIAAAAALDYLAAEQIDARPAEVIDLLKSGNYDNSRQTQQRILDTLEQVQRLLQQGASLEQEARRKTLEAIAKTVSQQKELRRKTESNDLANVKNRSDLASDQRRIIEQLAQLREPLAQLAPVGEQLLAASEAATQAAEHLGGGDGEQAVERQDTVLNMLDDIAMHLNGEALDGQVLADQLAQLEELGTSLNELLEEQAEAKELAAADPASAAELEAAIANSLDEADDASRLSGDVEAALDQAQVAVDKAREALEDASPDGAASRLAAVDDAEQSLMEAAAEVQSQGDDLRQAMEAANPSENGAASRSASKSEASSGTTRDAGGTGPAEPGVEVPSRSFESEAWFTSLPTELQNRIRAATRRPPPRGYEERLQRYFQMTE